jgi:hypothetical protein
MTPTEQAVLEAIRAEPGLHPKDYWMASPVSYRESTRAARRLVRAGLVRTTGATSATRYWPVTSPD